jgi:hypothetical protein
MLLIINIVNTFLNLFHYYNENSELVCFIILLFGHDQKTYCRFLQNETIFLILHPELCQ